MRVRLESVADWLAASDPGPQLTSSDEGAGSDL